MAQRNPSPPSIRIRAPILGLLAAAILLAAGCGDEEEPQQRPRPAFEPAVGRELAAQANEINELLGAGDPCGAEDRARALREQVEGLAADREIERRLSRPLLAGIDAAIGRIECVRQVTIIQEVEPPEDDDEDDEDEGEADRGDDDRRADNGRGRGRGRSGR